MTKRVLSTVLVFSAALGAGCAPSVCDRSARLAGKQGDCSAAALGDLLAPGSTCPARVSACSEVEQQAIGDALACLEKLPTCAAPSEAAWLADQAGCLGGLASLSSGCSQSLFGGAPPGTDGGSDGGTADAGRQPMDGGAVELIAVADETSMALAWAPLQAGQVAKWELSTFSDGGRTDALLTPGALRALMIPGVSPRAADGGAGPAVERSFFVTGLLNDGTVVMGAAPDAGGGTGFMCQGPFDCPATQICDLGVCRTEACSVSNPACPAGYDCPSGTCTRSADAGSFDAGATTMPGTFVSLPFISNLAAARTGSPAWAAPVPVGGFAARRPDMVAIDSARQFIAVEQEGQPVGHISVRRGKDLVSDLDSASVIDSVGDHVKVTYVADSDTIFACYNVGRGVRVRRSRDHGRTWGNDALTFEPVEDGGFSSRMHSCALAPWRSGSALMVNVDDDALVVRTITEALSVASTEVAFLSSPPDGGLNVYNPVHPAIGTAPDAGIVHVAFTGQRVLASASDYEVYDVYRTPGMGGYSQPKFINQNLPLLQGNGQNQGYPSVAVDPLSGRAVAAFTSVEGTYANVYVSVFSPAAGEWTTGSDLQVFVKQTTACLRFPARNCSGPNDWDAFSPTVRATADGKIWLGFIAGRQAQPPATTKTDFRAYAVRFDFQAQSPVGGLGWFIKPAEKLGDTVILDPRQGGGQTPPSLSSLAVDGQLSIYGAYVEGIGAFNEVENRAVYFSRP